MRHAFATTLAELAARDQRILLLTGDLGFMALEPFTDRFPDRFFNVGVAEQNMVGLATGLAEAGFIPFVYSINTFAALRPYEFLRNGPVLHQFRVRVIGVGGGFEYGTAGTTHHGLEDVGVMRIQPGLTVVAPADYQQTREALLKTWDRDGPIFYRLGKDDKTIVPGLNGRYETGRVQVLRDGRNVPIREGEAPAEPPRQARREPRPPESDLLLLSLGSVATEVVGAADALAAEGVSVSVGIVACVNPPPVDDLRRLLGSHRLAMTVEAHYAAGGLGSLVAEVLAEMGNPCRLVRRAVGQPADGITGSTAFLHRKHGLSSEALVLTALRELGKDGP